MIAQDETEIRGTLASYNDALNGGKTAALFPLYPDDGVFMPPYNQSAVGKDVVEKAYDAVFRELRLPGFTAQTNTRMCEVFSGVERLPRGVLSIFTEAHSAGARALIESPDVPVISLTGSSKTGKRS
jgi:Aldehyde dehydrogenase family